MNSAYVYDSAITEFRPKMLYASGPTSYANPGGDVVYNAGANEFINVPFDCTSKSGNYFVRFVPTAVGNLIIRAGAPSPSQSGWTAHWYNLGSAAGNSVASVTITAGGTYTGTTPSVTFGAAPAGGVTATGIAILNGAGTAVIGVLITNPGSGYVTAPTVTFGAGGATGTAVLTAASASGSEVANGTNLSAELIQFGALVSQL